MALSDRLNGIQASLAVKAPCKTVTTGPITLSGQQTVNGVACVAGDRVLVKDQTNAVENGIYVVSTTAWRRASDFDGNRDATSGTLVIVDSEGAIPATLPYAEPYYPTTAAEAAAGVVPSYTNYEPGDVRRYGAVGDGATDDHAAFTAAIAQNEQAGGAPIRSHSDIYYFSAPLSWCSGGQDGKVWVSDGSILTTNQDIFGLTIGPLSGGGQSFNLRLLGGLNVLNSEGSGLGTTNIGIRFGCCYIGEFHVAAKGWRTNIRAMPGGSGFVYNHVYFGDMRNGYCAFWADPQADGWVNENTFYGGRFAFPGSVVSHSQIYMPRTSASTASGGFPNNNVFLHPSLEGPDSGNSAVACYIDGGANNRLIHPRLECSTPLDKQQIWIQETALGYYIDGGLGARLGENLGGTYNASILNEGGRGTIIAPDQFFMHPYRSGGATTAHKVIRGDRNTNNLLPVVDYRDVHMSGGPSQVLRTVVGRTTEAASYHLDSVSVGNIVSHGDDLGDGEKHYYECILGHESGAASEPGVGADWRDYWERLHDYSNVYSTPGSNAWLTATVYTARNVHFRVQGNGRIWTNQREATATVGAQNGRMPIYDEAGSPLGYIPIHAAS